MTNQGSDQDRTAELLAATLDAEAAGVEAGPGSLQEIQRRTRSSTPSTRRWVWAVAGAGIATAAVITAVALISNSDAGGSASTPAAATPSSSIAAEPDVTLSVTYVGPKSGNPEGDGPGNAADMPRLFVETQTIPGTGEPLDIQAVQQFLTTSPADPDYSTGWPSGVEVEAISTAGGVTTVQLRGDADLESTGGLDEGQRVAAIQAFVKTVGGDAPVAIIYNGEPLTTLFGIDTTAPVQAKSEDDSRAWISIDNIAEGQTVADPVRVDVSGNVFEGNVNWSLTDDTGGPIDQGFATTSMGSWSSATIDLGTLDPGTYTFKAYEASAADGDEINVDTKTFTVAD